MKLNKWKNIEFKKKKQVIQNGTVKLIKGVCFGAKKVEYSISYGAYFSWPFKNNLTIVLKCKVQHVKFLYLSTKCIHIAWVCIVKLIWKWVVSPQPLPTEQYGKEAQQLVYPRRVKSPADWAISCLRIWAPLCPLNVRVNWKMVLHLWMTGVVNKIIY